MRLGSYVGGARPIKIRLKIQIAKKILAMIFMLKDCDDYKQVFIIKSMNEEETNFWRIKGRDKTFFFFVMDYKIKNWYIKDLLKKKRREE